MATSGRDESAHRARPLFVMSNVIMLACSSKPLHSEHVLKDVRDAVLGAGHATVVVLQIDWKLRLEEMV